MLGGRFICGDERLAVPATTHGGAGLQLAFTKAFLRGVTLVPGEVTGEGSPGIPIENGFADVTTWTAPVPLLEISSPVREFGTARLAATGARGDLALILASPDDRREEGLPPGVRWSCPRTRPR